MVRLSRFIITLAIAALHFSARTSVASGEDLSHDLYQDLYAALNDVVRENPTPEHIRYFEIVTAQTGMRERLGEGLSTSELKDLRWLEICAETTKGYSSEPQAETRTMLQACLDNRFTQYQEVKSEARTNALLAGVINDDLCRKTETSFKACIKALNSAAALLIEPKQLSRSSLKLTLTKKPLGELIGQANDTLYIPEGFDEMSQMILARHRVQFSHLVMQLNEEAIESSQRSAMAAVALNTFQIHTQQFKAQAKSQGFSLFAGWGNGRYDECNPIVAGCWRQPPLWYRFELETRVREIGVRFNGPETTVKFIHGGQVGAQGIYVPDEYYDPKNQVVLRPDSALYWTARIRQKQQGVNISYAPRWDHGTWFIQTEAGLYVYRLKMWVVGRHLNYDQGPAFNTKDGYLTQTGYKATASIGATIGRKLTDDLAYYCNITFFKEVKKKDAPAGGTNGQWRHAIFKKAGLQTGTCGLEYAIK